MIKSVRLPGKLTSQKIWVLSCYLQEIWLLREKIYRVNKFGRAAPYQWFREILALQARVKELKEVVDVRSSK